MFRSQKCCKRSNPSRQAISRQIKNRSGLKFCERIFRRFSELPLWLILRLTLLTREPFGTIQAVGPGQNAFPDIGSTLNKTPFLRKRRRRNHLALSISLLQKNVYHHRTGRTASRGKSSSLQTEFLKVINGFFAACIDS